MSNICYHSCTEGQTDDFFAHSRVNHTESHLLNTSTDFPPDILLYWHLNRKLVIANIPRNFREYKEEQKQFFPLKAVKKQRLIPGGEGSSTCRYPPPRILQASYNCHHIRLCIRIRHLPRIYAHIPQQWVVMSIFCTWLLSWKPAGKKPATCITSLLHDARSQAGKMLQYCLAKGWDVSGLQMGTGIPVLWSLMCTIHEDYSFLPLQKKREVEGRKWKSGPGMDIFGTSVCFIEVGDGTVTKPSSLLNPQSWNLQA